MKYFYWVLPLCIGDQVWIFNYTVSQASTNGHLSTAWPTILSWQTIHTCTCIHSYINHSTEATLHTNNSDLSVSTQRYIFVTIGQSGMTFRGYVVYLWPE